MNKKIILEKIKNIKEKHKNFKNYLKVLSEIALSKGGKVKKGEQYINAHTKMTFINEFGKEFKMTPSKIKSGRWPKKHT